MSARIIPFLLCMILCLSVSPPVSAQEEPPEYAPTRYGFALLAGKAYDPEQIGLLLVQGQMLLDYDRVFWHAAPESLRLKFEVNAGATADSSHRAMLSVNMMALYYFGQNRPGRWTPYVEAGIGLIYTDYQVEGQGLKLNFNPQAGVGVEYGLSGGGAIMTAFRLHHISNGNTYEENRGVNSALFLVGYLF